MIVIYTRAYNAGLTIRKTIDSILNQSYRDFKYIILDNGSTDDTLQIMREYARKDNRIIILHSDINKTNFSSCKGILQFIVNNFDEDDFFCNIDADDTYEKDFFLNMSNFMHLNDLDMAFCGYDILERNTEKRLKTKCPEESYIMEHDELAERFCEYRPYTTDMWAKLFRVSLLERYLDEERFVVLVRRNHSQQNFIYDALDGSNKVGFLAQILFHYYESTVARKNQRMEGNISILQIYTIFEIMDDFLKKIPARDDAVRRKNRYYILAIYCGYIKDTIDLIKWSNAISPSNKFNYLYDIFNYNITKEMLTVHADDSFLSLQYEEKKKLCDGVVNFLKEEQLQSISKSRMEKILRNISDCMEGARKGQVTQ